MQYISHYESPLGRILLAADDTGLTGLWFEGSKYCPCTPEPGQGEDGLPLLSDAKRWLDIYFSGRDPGFNVPLHFKGTDFQNDVWEILCGIPYGQTVTYSEIAWRIAKKRGSGRMSARAVGGAVGRNNISIIVPCHRVIGSDGSLTGYSAGTEIKEALLKLEKADVGIFSEACFMFGLH